MTAVQELVPERLNSYKNTVILNSDLEKLYAAGGFEHVLTKDGNNATLDKLSSGGERVYVYRTKQKVPCVNIAYDEDPPTVSIRCALLIEGLTLVTS